MKRIHSAIAAFLIILMIFGGIWMLFRHFNTVEVPILLYHHITEDGAGASTIAEDTFLSHLDALQAAGYQTITFQQLMAYVTEGAALPDKPILITFDDGYLSNYEIAWPALMERDMVATIFVIGSSMGKDTYKETGVPIIPHFSYEQAEEMVASGVISIQSHTFDMHQSPDLEKGIVRTGVCPLPGESSGEYTEALYGDFSKSIRELSAHTKEPVIALAYPQGLSTRQSEQVCRNLGISVTLTTAAQPAKVTKFDPRTLSLLGRFQIDDISPEELLKLIGTEKGREIAYEDYSGTRFEESLKLYKVNGTYLNFYVKNTGTSSVVLTINGENARTLAPGEAGHIFVKVNDIFGFGKFYTLVCRPAVNGAKIDIIYAIAQRNTQ